MNLTKKILLVTLVVAATALVFSGCLLRVHNPHGVVMVGPPVEYGYEPILYGGYVVYYTDDGIPFFWSDGIQVWIPEHERAIYLSHWQRHRNAYHNWYKHVGHQYHNHYYEGRGGKPVIRPQNSPPPPGHNKPVIRPQDDNDKPVIRPRNDDDDKPVIRPRNDDDDKPVIRPRNDDDDKPVIRPKNDDDDDENKRKKVIRPK